MNTVNCNHLAWEAIAHGDLENDDDAFVEYFHPCLTWLTKHRIKHKVVATESILSYDADPYDEGWEVSVDINLEFQNERDAAIFTHVWSKKQEELAAPEESDE